MLHIYDVRSVFAVYILQVGHFSFDYYRNVVRNKRLFANLVSYN